MVVVSCCFVVQAVPCACVFVCLCVHACACAHVRVSVCGSRFHSCLIGGNLRSIERIMVAVSCCFVVQVGV